MKEIVTIKEWSKDWIDFYLFNLKDRTLENYISILNNHIFPYFNDQDITSIKRKDVQHFIRYLHQKKLSPKTIHNIYLTLHRLFRDAVTEELIETNPANSIILPRKEKKSLNILEENEVGIFLKKAYELFPKDAKLFEFILLTGLRKGEAIGLVISKFNPIKGSIIIDQQYDVVTNKGFRSTKSSDTRTLFLNERAIRLIESSIKENRNFDNPYEFIFLNAIGEHFKNTTLGEHFKQIVKEIGKENLRIHDLRHTYAMLSLQSGMDIKTLQQNLGHADSAFTLNKYGHSTDRMKKQSSKNFEKLFNDLTD